MARLFSLPAINGIVFTTMRCDLCGKDDELFFIRGEGSADELALCRDCAAKRGYAGSEALTGAGFGAFLSPEDPQAPDRLCPSCGRCARAVLADGRLGCPDCARFFRRELGILWRRSGRPARYTGKVPPAGARPAEDAGGQSLREELARAVMAEDFELAARLRDSIAAAGEADGRGKDVP